MPESRERLTAKKVRAEDLKTGRYFEKEGFDPNYLLTGYGMAVSRARVLGTVVDVFVNDDESYGAITIDDGSDTIRAKFFQELDMMEGVEEGDIVEVLGKVKKYDGEIYVNPEMVVHRGPSYELARGLELENFREEWSEYVETAKELAGERDDESVEQELKGEGLNEREAEGVLKFVEEGGDIEVERDETGTGSVPPEEARESSDEEESGDHREEIVEAIGKLDEGEGVEYSEIMEETGVEEEVLEDVINDLLSDGTCYEPRPGRIKKL